MSFFSTRGGIRTVPRGAFAGLWRRLARGIAGAMLAIPLIVAAGAARAETIPLSRAELRIEDNQAVFNAEYDLKLTASLEEALQRGVPLYFVFEWKVSHERWYWFDKTALTGNINYRLSYLPLTRQYRLATGLLSQDVASIDEAERLMGRITSRSLFSLDSLESGRRYTFAARLRLDNERMPKPFQITALGSRDWNLASSWHALDFQP